MFKDEINAGNEVDAPVVNDVKNGGENARLVEKDLKLLDRLVFCKVKHEIVLYL